MLLKKQILLFYLLVIISAGVIIAAERPPVVPASGKRVKCCKAPRTSKPDLSTPPLYYITEGLFRLNA